jgi:asparagine synthase (glutamine-hydrolysing)
MTDVIAYRGPDDEGHAIHGNVALGHRRLSILDLSPLGHQPMYSADGQLAIVFNGEIYNFVELRQELEAKGATFRSHSDTEVILEAYRHWGPDCVQRFNGMWALALLDLKAHKLFLSRDRFGIKPLYMLESPEGLFFASEIKAILTARPQARKASRRALFHFLPGGMLDDGPETFFPDVVQLPQAHNAIYDTHSGRMERTWRYGDLDAEAFAEKWVGSDPVESLWELLQSSIQLHMRSDVPVGTCLSGGVDSSTIVALMSRQRTAPVHTFSGLYPDKDCDEHKYVDLVNQSANTIPCPVYPEPQGDLVDDMKRITWHQDIPTAGPGLYTQWHVMKRARQDVKVILDGQGGDELLAGYVPYFRHRLHDLLDRGFAGRMAVLRLSAQIGRHWGTTWVAKDVRNRLLGAGKAGEFAARKLQGLRRRLYGPAVATAPDVPFYHPALAEECGGIGFARQRPQRLKSRLDNQLYWDLAETSIPALLHYEDRNSMAHSIEARVPLLDYRVVEYALGLSADYKIRGSWTKWVLRECASRVLPAPVAWRRSKMGYPTPFARWLRQEPDRSQIEEIIFSREFRQRELVPEESVRAFWKQHQDGTDRSWLIYRYLTLELWHRDFIDAAPAQARSLAA